MAQLSINVGSTDYAGDGESLRNALIKVNTNFTEVYADISSLQTSVSNSFDGDYNSLTNKPTIPTALSDLTNDLDYASIVGSAIQNNGLPVLSTQNLDISGSVFADDSTPLVDSVNGKVVGPIEAPSVSVNGTFNFTTTGASDQLANIEVPDGGSLNINQGTAAVYFNGNGEDEILTIQNGKIRFPDETFQTTAWTGIGDLTGSVFADDS